MFACVYVPEFPLQAVRRAAPDLQNVAVVVLNSSAPLFTVAAANSKARQMGIQVGMTRLQAETCPGVAVHWRSAAAELETNSVLLECAQSFSPRVEAVAPETLVLDIAGLDHLFGSSQQIAKRLAQAARNLGLEVNVAIAQNADAAILAARGIAGITVIPIGEEVRYLSKLPVEVLELTPEMSQTLERWGIRTSHDLAALPEIELSERLGQEGCRLQRLSRGLSSGRPIVPVEEPLSFTEVRELDYALESLEPLSFILSALLSELCMQLERYSLAASEVRLALELDSRAVRFYERTFKLSVPTRDSKVLLKLLQLNLEAHPPEAAIIKVTLGLEPAGPRTTQHGLFLKNGPEPQKLELALTRITNLIGEERVGAPELLDTHSADAFRMTRFRGTALPENRLRKTAAPARNHCRQAVMRRFRPPLRARVWLREGRPISFSFSGMHGKVMCASGPWRTSGDWWRHSRWECDEWDVAASMISKRMLPEEPKPEADVALYRISYDLFTSRWLVEGTYD